MKLTRENNPPADRVSIRTPDQKLRVFVSSTMTELAEERRVASEAILQLRMSPVLFEIGARPHPPRELYTAYLDQSDVFVGIYGEQYGWVDSRMAISGIEDEYELASGKPRLIYVKQTQGRDPRLDQFLERIIAEGSVSYKMYSDCEQLRELIKDDLALLLSERFQRADAAHRKGRHGRPLRQASPEEPEVQYVTTDDGVSIAYYAVGQGPALLALMLPFSHLEEEWRTGAVRDVYTGLARRSTLIRLDHRGFGLSERDVDDFSIEKLVLDIEAVVDRLAVRNLKLYSLGFATVPALVYAARHPDIVTHFVQATPAVSSSDFTSDLLLKLFEIAEVDWHFATETISRSYNPGAPERLIQEIAGLVRASIDREGFLRFFNDMKKWDAEAEARTISVPTLLIHRENPNMTIAATRRVAGLIKDSRVAFMDNADIEGAILAQKFFFGKDISVEERKAQRA